jgi:hypothetical protein
VSGPHKISRALPKRGFPNRESFPLLFFNFLATPFLPNSNRSIRRLVRRPGIAGRTILKSQFSIRSSSGSAPSSLWDGTPCQSTTSSFTAVKDLFLGEQFHEYYAFPEIWATHRIRWLYHRHGCDGILAGCFEQDTGSALPGGSGRLVHLRIRLLSRV